ncbi:MAG TPA: DUF4910 domain-containing protein [Anaerolineae bacterium]|nr:DUF4910 domain-containing protein [Anaerolineae bacterium]
MIEGMQEKKAKVIDLLKQAGVNSGDIVLVHSDSTLAMKLSGAESWAEALQFLQSCFEAVLGESGTLIVPTFTYDFCKGKPYNHLSTPSTVGFFTNHIRRNPHAVRSFHPIFSFAAIGGQAHTICDKVSKSSFGKDSVFDRLFHSDSKLLFFNTTFDYCTFIHYVEQQMNVDYRYKKYFTGEVFDGIKKYIDTFDFFVRYLDRNVTVALQPMSQRLLQSGCMKQVEVDGGVILQVKCQDVYRETAKVLCEDPYFLIEKPPKELKVIVHQERSGSIEKKDDLKQIFRNGRLKKEKRKIKDTVAEIFPLNRALVSEGINRAFEFIKEDLEGIGEFCLETYRSTYPVWTWRIPERYVVNEAYLETPNGERVIDVKNNPLHLVSYSIAIDKSISWAELEPHLHYSEKRPGAIPWEFKYYERGWGFCLSKDLFEKLPRDVEYHVVIRSVFSTVPEKGLKTATLMVNPEGDRQPDNGEILICTHVCHPNLANDDASGVAVAMEVAKRLKETPLPAGSMDIRFLFCPETIGSISYFSQHEEIIPKIRGGIFIEMAGNNNRIALQRSRQDSHLIDRIARKVIKERDKKYFEDGFRNVVGNDEMVINGPGVNIPCISISRWPYDEYHTSDDNLDIIREKKLVEMADIVEEIIRIFATNYVPKRKFKGPIFLSGYGLWVDWRVNKPLNLALEKIFLRFEGDRSIFEIAEELDLDYWEIREYIEKFKTKDLIDALPIK